MGAKVKMIHENFPKKRPAIVDKVAFDRVWKDKGWSIVEDEKTDAKAVTTTPTPASTPTPDSKKSDNS